jgi:hypothetical protein
VRQTRTIAAGKKRLVRNCFPGIPVKNAGWGGAVRGFLRQTRKGPVDIEDALREAPACEGVSCMCLTCRSAQRSATGRDEAQQYFSPAFATPDGLGT